MAGATKRRANVPQIAGTLIDQVSKADLLEAAWYLAALCNDGNGADDERATMKRLVQELNNGRDRRRERPLKVAQ